LRFSILALAEKTAADREGGRAPRSLLFPMEPKAELGNWRFRIA
jgi:hypothetical protein